MKRQSSIKNLATPPLHILHDTYSQTTQQYTRQNKANRKSIPHLYSEQINILRNIITFEQLICIGHILVFYTVYSLYFMD